jgi:hypothetical protein
MGCSDQTIQTPSEDGEGSGMTDKHPNASPCPFCGSSDLLDESWFFYDGELDAIECAHCQAVAPASVWNRRPSPWRYPERGDPMPSDGQRILMTYQRDTGEESSEICMTWDQWTRDNCDMQPIVRWMSVPSAE